jgi:DNA-binding XRE family transcriptional regulator
MPSASSTPTKYQRGVQHLRPELLKRIKREMEKDPTSTKTALAARVGVSRQTLNMYLRGLPQAAAEATVKAEESRTTAITTTHVDLISAVGRAVEDVQEEIAKLRACPTSPGASGVIFRGFATLERLWRLLGELLGQVSPPEQHVYITQVNNLLNQQLDPGRLSPSARELPGIGADGGAAG